MGITRIYEWPLYLRVAIMIGVALLVFCLLYFFDIMGLKNQLRTAQQQEQELKDQLASTLNKQFLDRKELDRFKLVQGQLQQWQGKLINYSELPQLIDKILKIGASNNIDFTLFSPGSPVKEDLYLKVPISINAVGSYDALSRLLSEIAALPTLTVINNFSITTEIKNGTLNPNITARPAGDQLLMLDMIVEVYYLAHSKQ